MTVKTKLEYMDQLMAYVKMTQKINRLYVNNQTMTIDEWHLIVNQMFEDCDNAGFEFEV